MAHVLTDWRKTALGAGGLAVLAIMFTHEGGVAETAVTGAEELASRNQAQIRAGAETHKAWFAADESTYEVHAVAPPPRAALPGPDPAEIGVAPRREPVGPDFPAGLAPPGQAQPG
ncbi:hypothetical protein ACFOD9_01770 [Novosphingobium bradum]|uniref:Secreted protein n=1 Tax=Novosphingobium bradum TaxID=1737444 RepID=A0ABV7ILV7_9SPHN